MKMAKRPPGRPAKSGRREEILRAAAQAFSVGGIAGTTMGAIARQAGTAEGTLYLHFDSKDALVEAVIAGLYDDVFPDIMKLANADSPASARLLSMAERHLRIYADDPPFARLLLQHMRAIPDYRSSNLHARNQRYAAVFLGVLKQGVASGEMRADLVPRVARDALLGALDYRMWLASVTGRPISPEGDARALMDLLLGGLVAGASAAGRPGSARARASSGSEAPGETRPRRSRGGPA